VKLLGLRCLLVAVLSLGSTVWGLENSSLGPLSFDPRGADFRQWVDQFKDQLYQHWPPRTGVPAGARGYVVLEFTVARNGSLQRVRVKKSSGEQGLRMAAQEALRASRPLPLPAAYKRETITMRLDFHLNEEPPDGVQNK
jgi:TonB family protein